MVFAYKIQRNGTVILILCIIFSAELIFYCYRCQESYVSYQLGDYRFSKLKKSDPGSVQFINDSFISKRHKIVG